MAVFRCSHCDEFKDGDYVECHDDGGDGLLCSECYINRTCGFCGNEMEDDEGWWHKACEKELADEKRQDMEQDR